MKFVALMAATAAGVLLCGVASASPASGGETYELLGTVGPYGVGASITVDESRVEVAHYFYDSQLKDIPLVGSISGNTLTLMEAGGGVFHLTMQGNGGAGGDGGSMATSVALTGTWTEGAKVLPVKLDLESAYAGAPSGHLYADVTNESDAAFEARVQQFLAAVLAGNKAVTAANVSYPLAVNGTPKLTITTSAQLIADWSTVFTPKMLTALRTAVPHDMFVSNGQAMVAGGAAWFDAKGASALNEP